MEASTVLWEEVDSVVMDHALNLHHACLRDCVVRHQGVSAA